MNLADDTAKLSLDEALPPETIRQKPFANGTNKRVDYLEWEEYFMANAMLAAKRSKDPITQVGACIVNKNNRVVGIGYNGMPNRCNDDLFPWSKSPGSIEHKHLYVCHAEMNAIMNKTSADVNGCTIYVTLFPCNECTKMIIQAGINEVVYLSDKKADKLQYRASKRMFEAANVNYRLYTPKNKSILISFSEYFDQLAPGQADQSPQ